MAPETKPDIEKLSELKKGDTILVKCKIETKLQLNTRREK